MAQKDRAQRRVAKSLKSYWVNGSFVKSWLPIQSDAWTASKQAQALLGAEIEYRADSFRWKTTNVQSSGSSTNLIGAQEFAQGNSGSGSHVDFNQLGIVTSAVEQITIIHPDVKIAELSQTGSAAVPGESVLVEGPNTIIFDVCNTFFEARRE